MSRKKILVALGTRPEAIKLAPVILALRNDEETFECLVCGTAQHRSLLDQVLEVFGISLDFDLELMRTDQEPADVFSRGLRPFMRTLADTAPDLVLIQGDTASTFLAAYAAFLSKLPVAHVEAGLRTYSSYDPFPEETNRRLTSAICDLHFSPTERARRNLLSEGVEGSRIAVTGNTVIDALLFALDKIDKAAPSALANCPGRLILVTAHRRESFGEPIRRICSALERIAAEHKSCTIAFPVHPNPNVRSVVTSLLSGVRNIELLEPLGYDDFAGLMRESYLILTDSGGIQEEAPSLGKPTLVLRERTERPEGLEAGAAKLVGSDPERIFDETSRLLADQTYYRTFVSDKNPYGDGRASERIVAFLREHIQTLGRGRRQ